MRNALKLMIFALFAVLSPDAAWALNCTANPYTLTNNSTADANQVMSNFNNLLNCANNNLAHNGANSDITSLSALSTPLSVAQGGTGATTATGSGLTVLQTSPTLITPTLGVASATSIALGGGNALDTYLAQGWGPNDGSGAGLSFTVGTTRYTKVGRARLASAAITFQATGSGAQAAIAGLDAAPSGAPVIWDVAVMNAVTDTTATAMYKAIQSSGSSTAYIINPTTGAAVTNATLSGKLIIIQAQFVTP